MSMLLLPHSNREAKRFIIYILPKVSRTFALNISVLTGEKYFFIACCYLICRTIDTIEDSPHTSPEKKITYLTLFKKIFKKSSDPSHYSRLIKQIIPVADNRFERELLEKFHWVMFIYHQFSPQYHRISLPPILEMTQGMCHFIQKYSTRSVALIKSEAELERYCYYVAGTIGKLLTELFCLELKSEATKKILREKMISFGLGLQITNIAKDFQKDALRGWSYIPIDYLKDEKISYKEFLIGKFPSKIKKIHLRLIEKATLNLEEALIYTISIPKKMFRYRFFCFIPLFLAIASISFLKKKPINQNSTSKIKRKNVYIILIYAFLASLNNYLSKKIFIYLKNK